MPKWVVVRVRCRICGHQCVAVQPTDMVRNGECSQCGHFACEIEEYL